MGVRNETAPEDVSRRVSDDPGSHTSAQDPRNVARLKSVRGEMVTPIAGWKDGGRGADDFEHLDSPSA